MNLLLIQIDGLSLRRLRQALDHGIMPRLSERLRSGWLRLESARVDLPSGTVPFQLGLFYGRSDLAPNTRKSMRTALRSFYRWAEDTGALPTEVPNPAEKLPTVRVRRALPRPAPDEAVLPEPPLRHARR